MTFRLLLPHWQEAMRSCRTTGISSSGFCRTHMLHYFKNVWGLGMVSYADFI